MSTSLKIGIGAVAVLVLTACGTGSEVLDEGPSITWDQPIPQGRDVTTTPLDSLGLPFEPVTSEVLGELVMAQMTVQGDGPPTLGLLYRLPADIPASADPRVHIYETFADITMAELESASYEGEERELVTLSSTTALLVQHGGVGRLIFIADGIKFDIAGPALTVDKAMEVAEALEAQAYNR